MKEGPVIATVAALIGDPARANILSALMDGRALTVSELANVAGVTIQTASGHLSRLADANLLAAEKQGRHRYYRLAGEEIAIVLEALLDLAQKTGATRVRTGPKDTALRKARICYDHLAGEYGVTMLRSIAKQGFIAAGDRITLTDQGRVFFDDFGIDIVTLEQSRRPLCLHCLDWSERRHHLGGALGAAIMGKMLDQQWIRRGEGRTITFTPKGLEQFKKYFPDETP
ncbi:helix-turn-helix transcriptional regulator [Microvirga sp. W0021]|uniref:Helix-turn-helix transcriptional regulator n=1 Tax=Hohaiivirga grylli TaxID=3133970 RepID=A0ABV0BFC9_9HYPH